MSWIDRLDALTGGLASNLGWMPAVAVGLAVVVIGAFLLRPGSGSPATADLPTAPASLDSDAPGTVPSGPSGQVPGAEGADGPQSAPGPPSAGGGPGTDTAGALGGDSLVAVHVAGAVLVPGLHLLPSGILTPGATCVIANGVVVDPVVMLAEIDMLESRGVDFLDAPVSGGVSGAAQGTLTVMAGGKAVVLERVRPILERFGKRIVHCGEVGAGDAVKAVNNALLAMHIWSTAEGLAALEKAGVRASVALDVINTSSGRSNASMNLFPERVLTRAFPRTFRLALLDKDVGIAANFARSQKVPSPLLQLTAELYTAARAELGEEADHVEAVRVVERMAAQQIGGEA